MPPSALSPLPPLLRAALLPSRPSRGRAPRPDVSVRAEPASLAGPGIGARQRRWLTATPPRGFLSEPGAGLAAPPPPPRGAPAVLRWSDRCSSLFFSLSFNFPCFPMRFWPNFLHSSFEPWHKIMLMRYFCRVFFNKSSFLGLVHGVVQK